MANPTYFSDTSVFVQVRTRGADHSRCLRPSTLHRRVPWPQFSIGLESSRAAFVSALVREGVPCAVLALVAVLVLSRARWSPWRLHPFLARLRTTTHPAALFWGSVGLWALICTVFALFVSWGVLTAANVRPHIVGLGILLLIPAFTVIVWEFVAWRAMGWSSHPRPRSVLARTVLDNMPYVFRLVRRVREWNIWPSSHPIKVALLCGTLLYTGYELSVVYNGDTVTTRTAAGDLRQVYVHR